MGHNVFAGLVEQLQMHIFIILALLFVIVLMVVSLLVQDFLGIFHKKPAHFLPFSWSRVFRVPVVKVPLVKLEHAAPARELLKYGSELYPGRAFKISIVDHEIVILPHEWNYIINNTSIKTLTFQECFFDLGLGAYNGINTLDASHGVLLRKHLNRIVENVHPTLSTEASESIGRELGTCEDWTLVMLFPKLVATVNRLSAIVFVGEPLCKDPNWLASNMAVLTGTFGTLPTLWGSSRWARPFVAWTLPALRMVRRQNSNARKLLAPILKQSLNPLEKQKPSEAKSVLQAVRNTFDASEQGSLDAHVQLQMNIGSAALFTTTTSCFHVLYQLATHPEYVDPIRKEIADTVIGSMDKTCSEKLFMLDSFIRETQRWCNLTQLGPMRKVLREFHLPDGTTLPIGSYIALDAQKALFDNSGLENPFTFDGFRFARMRTSGSQEKKFEAAAPSPNNFAFGSGAHSCPGRSFAIYEIKLLVARIVMDYEFCLTKEAEQTPLIRPAGLVSSTNPAFGFMFKRRQDVAEKTSKV